MIKASFLPEPNLWLRDFFDVATLRSEPNCAP